MNDVGNSRMLGGVPGGIVAAIAAALVIGAAVILLHGPAVDLALTGDSYQWIQHAHAATHDPGLLLADLDTFLRPSTTWTLALDRATWGGFSARGFRISSLAIHALTALLLVVAGRRLGLGSVAACAVGLLWATSPYTDESAFVVAYRFQPLLLISWLALVAFWPRPDEDWSRARIAAVTVAVVLAAAAKETWVVTPALAAALEVDRRRPFREALRPAVAIGAAALIYVTWYFVAFPGSKAYYVLGGHVLAKVPAQLAAFFYLREPTPFAPGLSWQGIVGLVAFVAVVVSCLRRRLRGTWTALGLFLLPTLPTILVPFMPQRYLAIPYAGFLLLVTLWLGETIRRLPRWRRAIAAVTAVVAAAVVAAGGSIVRADLQDYRRMAKAHSVLLCEASAVAASVAAGGPVLVVRDEQDQPLVEILRAPAGIAKLPYTRHADPYGLIDAAALFEWVIAEEGTRVEPVLDWPTGARGRPGRVLIHTSGGFIDRGVAPDIAAEALRWRDEGRRVRVIRTVRP